MKKIAKCITFIVFVLLLSSSYCFTISRHHSLHGSPLAATKRLLKFDRKFPTTTTTITTQTEGEQSSLPTSEKLDNGLKVAIFTSHQGGDVGQVIQSMESWMAINASNVVRSTVPDPLQFPLVLQSCIKSLKADVGVCLSCLLQSSQPQWQGISQTLSQALMKVSLDTGIPIVNGILVAKDLQEAIKLAPRFGKDLGNTTVAMGKWRRRVCAAENIQQSLTKRKEKRSSSLITFAVPSFIGADHQNSTQTESTKEASTKDFKML